MDKLSNIHTDFAQWYQDVIAAAELADHSPVRGCMVIRPYGYAIWEHIVAPIDAEFKKMGIENAYFPLFIPESFLHKEAQHVEGFSPELAVVTHAGGKELDEPLVVRPTSETIIYAMFAEWIKSWRDLPMKINQWANVVRWEMRTRPFLRTTEFLWQEGHTAHETHDEAVSMAHSMLEFYARFAQEYLAMPVIKGMKSPQERFAGAERTYTFEGCMGDGKALQMGTSHVLLQQFSRAFDIQFQDRNGELQTPVCTSWGVTTRLIGAMIMVHGDENGLCVPPRVAPIHVVIVPIAKTDEDRIVVEAAADGIAQELTTAGIRVRVDKDTEKTPGAKYYHWEVRGVPLRFEIGMRDLAAGSVMVAPRVVRPGEPKKQALSRFGIVQHTQNALNAVHEVLFERAQTRMKSQWHQGDTLLTFGPKLAEHNGLYQTGWCGAAECEKKFKEYTATLRCLLPEKQHTVCCVCGAESVSDIIVAKAY